MLHTSPPPIRAILILDKIPTAAAAGALRRQGYAEREQHMFSGRGAEEPWGGWWDEILHFPGPGVNADGSHFV